MNGTQPGNTADRYAPADFFVKFNQLILFPIKSITVISGDAKMRTGGPQVPAPLVI
jgi:hypothetical protein